jgi:hypothetical protein
VLPSAYELPVAVGLVLGGALACFAGYRLFRIVLGIYGFILGATMASSIMGVNSHTAMVVAAILGGLAGSIVLVMAYFVGIALVGGGLGALIGHVAWGWVGDGDPPVVLVIVVATAGAIGAMLLQRYVIIAGTALGGAWTMVVGAANLLAAKGVTRGASATDVWILYPTAPADAAWVPYAFVLLTIAGLAIQLGMTSGKKK